MKKIIVTTLIAIAFVILSAMGIVGAAEAFAADGTTIEKSFDSSDRELVSEVEEMKENYEGLDDWTDGYITTKYFEYEIVDGNLVHVVIVLYTPLDGYITTDDVADISDVSAANAEFDAMYEMTFEEWLLS